MLTNIKQTAQQAFDQTGFDLKHVETWRYTNLARLLPDMDGIKFPGRGQRPTPTVNVQHAGVIVKKLSDVMTKQPEKVGQVLEQYAIDYQQHPLAALNHAELSNGLWIEIADNTVLKEPLHITYPELGEYCHFIFVGKYAQVTICEEVTLQVQSDDVGAGLCPRPVNSLTYLICDEGSQVDYYAKQSRNAYISHIANLQTWQSRNAIVNTMHASYGGKVGRFDIHVRLQGEGAECELNGLFSLTGKSHTDHHICVAHLASYTKSNVCYKGLAADQSTGIWTAKALVHAGVKQVDAQQNNKNLLLSKKAFIHTKPELEIYADDLKCSHGATVGQLDEQALFYLQSRGIDLVTAKQLLIDAFCEDIVAKISDETLRAWIEK